MRRVDVEGLGLSFSFHEFMSITHGAAWLLSVWCALYAHEWIIDLLLTFPSGHSLYCSEKFPCGPKCIFSHWRATCCLSDIMDSQVWVQTLLETQNKAPHSTTFLNASYIFIRSRGIFITHRTSCSSLAKCMNGQRHFIHWGRMKRSLTHFRDTSSRTI